MNEIILPNEMMLTSSEKALLRDCIRTLSTESLAEELGQDPWTVTRAEFCQPELFLSEMQFFARQHPFEHKQLCETIGDRKRVGVFQFQLPRTSEMRGLPQHIVGRLLIVVTDADKIIPLWRFTSLLLS